MASTLRFPTAGLTDACRDAVALAAVALNVDAASIMSDARRDPLAVCRARQVAIYLLHVGLSVPQAEVGCLFKRDRSTVAHACTAIEDRRDDRRFDRLMDALEAVLVGRHRDACGPPGRGTSPALQDHHPPRLMAGFSFGPEPPEHWIEITGASALLFSGTPTTSNGQHP